MRISLFLLLILISINASAQSLSPCWFSSPVTQKQIGFIGAASPFSSKANGSLIASRQRAFEKLLTYYNFKSDENVDFTKSTVPLTSDTNIVFSTPYVDSQAMYSYASIEKTDAALKEVQQNWLIQNCPLQTCNFKGCSPSWLCTSRKNHLISVSQITSNPAKQLEKTYDNAQLLLQYISKSKVEDYSFRVKSEGKFQQWGYSEHKGQITALADKNNLLNTQNCQTPSYMFARYRYLQNLPSNKLDTINTKPFPVWRNEPSFNGTVGVVGIFSGITADGLFSSAIEHAIKEGLLELAKIKKINIEHNYQITSNNGLYSIAKTTMTTDTTVTAKLQDLKIIEENNQLVIYTWLLEANINQ
ncbi:MAG: hypothetical protein OQK09_08170 [Colwellia sp.]|nr:hypothetical protein [Colwellia sp.]MCW8863810.1 hypothetical protein [Colwellia sp.]MCW9081475.1 hypothetical protein [Colwellia sp.]